MKLILSFLFILILISCNHSKNNREVTKSETNIIPKDTLLIEYENKIKMSYEIGFYEKSFTYCWTIEQDTLDLKIRVNKYTRDDSIGISVVNQKPIKFTTVLNKIKECLPLIQKNFKVENLRSLGFHKQPIFYKDLTIQLSKDYESQFGQENISYEKLNEFLMNSWLEKEIGIFLSNFGKKTERYIIEKFHLLSKKNYGDYIPNSNLKDYPEFSLHGSGISIIIDN